MNGETCDRCGPAAYASVSVTFPTRKGFGLLTFCEHHAVQYVPNIPRADVHHVVRRSEATDQTAASETAT